MTAYDPEALKKLQSIELEMLKVVDEFCRAHEVPYFLESGTAIGCARHKGFIPWDDDIDIGIMKEDYPRFVRLFAENPPAGYSIHTHQNTENYPYMFAKVYREGTRFLARESIDAGLESCIYLDVFPHEFVAPQLSSEEAKAIISRAMFWQRMLYLYYTSNPAIPPNASLRSLKMAASKIGHAFVRTFMNPTKLAKRYDGQIARLSVGGSPQASRFIASVQDGVVVPVGAVFPLDRKMQFEGEEFPVPHNVDEYLRCLYGDWRQLPPEDKRKTHAPVVLDFGDL